MIEYRPFRNTDPFPLAEIWCSRGRLRGLVPSITPAILERFVLAKPYFDQQGLIVAVDDGRAVGFVHAGFGPLPDGSALDTTTGLICLLMVRPHDHAARIQHDLIEAAERYLQQRGARDLYGGTATPAAPFYEGLYGGCINPGILTSDQDLLKALRAAGYVDDTTRRIYQCSLAEFHPAIDRQLMAIRRSCQVQVMIDPPATSWWNACTAAWLDQVRFMARSRHDGSELGHVTFCDFQPHPPDWEPYPVGLSQLHVAPAPDPTAITAFLLGEALRQLRSEGIQLIETHVAGDQPDQVAILERLGFHPIDQAVVLRKAAP